MSLWDSMAKKEYQQVIDEIKSDPKQVNANDDNGRSILMTALGKMVKPIALIELILTHDAFNFDYKNENTGISNIRAIMAEADISILKFVINNPKFLSNEDLPYKHVVDLKKNAKSLLEMHVANPESSNHEYRSQLGKRVAQWEEKTAMLRDATIKLAIANDDTKLLDRLANLGDDVLANLSDNKNPQELVKDKQSKVYAWFTFAESLKALKDNRDTHFSKSTQIIAEIGKKEELATAVYMDKQLKTVETGLNKKETTFGRVLSAFGMK